MKLQHFKMICPYCKKEAQWVENKEIYGSNYGKSYMCYLCKDCNAYVGCHNNSRFPLGTMANEELRRWRIETHKHLDRLWKDKIFTRRQVYRMLETVFGKEVHIGEADINMCKNILRKLQKPIRVTK